MGPDTGEVLQNMVAAYARLADVVVTLTAAVNTAAEASRELTAVSASLAACVTRLEQRLAQEKP